LPEYLSYRTHEEKRTDVNIATQIIVDWVSNKYDKAIIITGDSDITPAIEAIKMLYPHKYFLCILPKEGKWRTISDSCNETQFLTEELFEKYQLPNLVISKWWKQSYERPKERK
jgi:hypothetical protein